MIDFSNLVGGAAKVIRVLLEQQSFGCIVWDVYFNVVLDLVLMVMVDHVTSDFLVCYTLV